MKLSDIKVNAGRIEQGAWVDEIPGMGDLRLRVRGIGNRDYRALQARLVNAVPRQVRVRGALPVVEQDRIQVRLLAETVIVDWAGLDDDDGQPIPFSCETALRLLSDPELGAFRDAVAWAASVVGEEAAATLEEDAGN